MKYINEFRLGPIHDGYEHVTCENEKMPCEKQKEKKKNGSSTARLRNESDM